MPIQAPLKDGNAEHPVADVWRPVIREIVKALVDGDYSRIGGIPSVAPPEKKTVDQIREYIEDFGETLVELPDDTWSSSVSQWMGTYWAVLVDLWTLESGGSDLALSLRVYEAGAGFRLEITSVHVP